MVRKNYTDTHKYVQAALSSAVRTRTSCSMLTVICWQVLGNTELLGSPLQLKAHVLD